MPTPTTPLTSVRNLTRFDYGRTAFKGWRLNVSCTGTTFCRYFPDAKFGESRDKSFRAASKTLKAVREVLKTSPRRDGKITKKTAATVEKMLEEAIPGA